MPGNLRFSTFGYDSTTPSPPPPPVSHIPMHQNQHNIQTSSAMVGTGSCPTHSQQTKNSTLPHQHHQHHHHYHHLQDQQANLNRDENRSKTATSKVEMNDFGGMTDDDAKHKKYALKKDETQARSFSDIRKSAPDVIIISGCNTSH